jgi:uncharacterized membrane protein
VAVSEAMLGFATGLRGAMPMALLLRAAEADGSITRLPGWLRRAPGARTSLLLAAGELVADKLPMTPSRLQPGALFGRVMSGAAVGIAAASRAGGTPVLGGLLGAGGALAGAYAGYHARQALGRAGVPDPVCGVVEDGVTIGLGLLALRGQEAEVRGA